MSVQAISFVLEHSEARLGARLVLLAIANHTSETGTNAFPSQATIAKEARLTDRQVRRCLKELEAAGEIVRDGHRTKGVAIWRIAGMTPDKLSDHALQHPGHLRHQPRTNRAENRSEMSDEPLREPSSEPSPPPSPKGGRKRDWDKYEQQLRDWVGVELPDLDETEAIGYASAALAEGRTSTEEVVAYVRRWSRPQHEAVAA